MASLTVLGYRLAAVKNSEIKPLRPRARRRARAPEACLSFWAGIYYVTEYPGGQVVAKGTKTPRHAIYRARRKGYSVRTIVGMYESSRVLEPLKR